MGSAGVAGLAGCTGGDGNSGSDGGSTPESTDEPDPTPTQTAEPEPDYSLPESEHVSPGQLASDWGTVFRHDETEYVDAYSPSQAVFEHNMEPWTRWFGGGEEFYPMFDWDPMHVPETIIQYTGSNSIKVDQLPNNVTGRGVKSALKEAGYEEAETVGEFDVLVNQDGNVRAVGDGYHVLFIDRPLPNDNLEQKRSDVENVLDVYNSGESELQSDMADMKERLEVGDTFASEVEEDGAYISGIYHSNLQPLGGAVTIDLAEGTKRGIWKFKNEDKAGTAKATTEADDMDGSGFDSLEQEGKYLVSGGTYQQGDRGTYFSPFPDI